MTKGHLFDPLVSWSFPHRRVQGGVALRTVAADNPALCERALLHKGLIVARGGPERGTKTGLCGRVRRGLGLGVLDPLGLVQCNVSEMSTVHPLMLAHNLIKVEMKVTLFDGSDPRPNLLLQFPRFVL